MRFARLYLALIFISGGEGYAQNTVANWFPIHVGDRWIYEHTTRDKNGEVRAHPDVHTWKTEETTTGSWTVPEGTLIGRKVRIIEGSPQKGWRVDPNPAFFIRGVVVFTEITERPGGTHRLIK